MLTLDHDDAARLLRTAETSWLHLPVLLALTTGMRRGEVLGLRWKDVDLEVRSIAVTQSLEQTAAGLLFKAPKTMRSRRTISLLSLTADALRRHRIRQAEALLRRGVRQDAGTLVCAGDDGAPLSPREVTKAFPALVRKAKIAGALRFHDLRHTHISHLLAAGVHPKIASERAGHASVAITLDVYSHVMPGMQEDAASRVDVALRHALDK